MTGVAFRVLGWLVLFGGLTFALFMLALLPGGFVGFAVGLPIAAATIAIAWGLLRGGRTLEREGRGTERRTKTEAIVALAQSRGGLVHAWDVSAALGIPLAQADALLTELAKSSPDHVGVEIDEASGALLYRVDRSPRLRVAGEEHVRVATPEELSEEQQERARQMRAP